MAQKNQITPSIPLSMLDFSNTDLSKGLGVNSDPYQKLNMFGDMFKLDEGIMGTENVPTVQNNAGGLLDFLNLDPETSQMLGDLTGLAQAGFGMYSGIKQLGMADDMLNFQKRAYNDNKAMTNADLQSRRNAQMEATGSTNIANVDWT